MLNRRLFLQTSSATLASLASINPSLAKGRTSKQDSVLDLVLFDERMETSRQFADDAEQNGSRTLNVGDDLNEQAFAELGRHFRSQKTVIAGYTKTHTAAYVLGLARDYGYQQVHFAQLEPEISQLLKENNAGKAGDELLVAWVLAPIVERV